MKPAVIFDLDGTLIDSLADIAAAMNRALASLQQPTHSVDAYREFIGDGVEKLVERALAPERADLRAQAVLAYRADYARNTLHSTVLYPGIGDLLDALSARGIPMGILSNKPDVPAKQLAAKLLARWTFGAVFGERSGVPRKPHPQAALELAAVLGTAPTDCWFVGDTPIDIHTALAAGMHAVGVRWGFRPELLESAGAEVVLTAPMELKLTEGS